MSNFLSLDDLDEKYRSKVYTQSYAPKETIEGVSVVELRNFVGEDGDFSEIIHLTDGKIEEFPDFHLVQVNRSKMLSGSIKAWHVHFKQEEIWYILPSSHMLVGLWDIRKNSKTVGKTMRFALGGGKSYLLYIPKGVAHGAFNPSHKPAHMIYFVDQKFDKDNPDERRLPWDSVGAEFWIPARD